MISEKIVYYPTVGTVVGGEILTQYCEQNKFEYQKRNDVVCKRIYKCTKVPNPEKN